MNEDHKTSKNQLSTPVFAPSNRPSLRPEFGGEKVAEASETSRAKGDGSIPLQGIASHPAAARPVKCRSIKLTRQQLEEIEARLSARDHAVLQAIRRYRFLTSTQIGRLYITGCSTKTSQTRQQNLLLQRLGGHGLIRPLERRVGGYGGGSTVQVWHLTEAGQRLLILNDPGAQPRKRFSEPSALFLRHTLAIAECAVQLICLCRDSDDLSLEAVDAEPSCWRKYRDDNRTCYLKPDLFAVTSYDGYEDRWFIEMDLGSESISQVLEKCNGYLRYYYTGLEQKATEMFPLVVWIVKDSQRKENLKSCIRENLQGHPKMFLVIAPDELEKMLRQFIDTKELC